MNRMRKLDINQKVPNIKRRVTWIHVQIREEVIDYWSHFLNPRNRAHHGLSQNNDAGTTCFSESSRNLLTKHVHYLGCPIYSETRAKVGRDR